jgi:hypothetical protein
MTGSGLRQDRGRSGARGAGKPRRWTWSRLRLTLGVVVLACAGCSFSDVSLAQDQGIVILNPSDSETVHQPFTVRWTGTPKAAEYAVFFDRTPMRPGGNLKSLVKRNDPLQSALNAANGQTVTPESCAQDPACPPPSWLNAHGVYVTNQLKLNVSALPDLRSHTSAGIKDRHQVMIVPLTSSGRRIGQTVAVKAFIIYRAK